MSVTQDIIESERNRTDSSTRCTIHLYKEGTFLRAYNWSAWLCCRYLHEFKVNKREFKNIEGQVAYIGFPETSLDKWLPEHCEPVVLGEKHYAIELALDKADSKEESMLSLYDEWFGAVPVTEIQKKKIKKDSPLDVDRDSNPTFTSIVQSIASFPVESKSPIDCMLFIAELKKQVAKFL